MGRAPWTGLCPYPRYTASSRRAFTHVKMQWVKLDAVKLIKEGPPEGKEHRNPVMYYEGVLLGAHLNADECSKDVVIE